MLHFRSMTGLQIRNRGGCRFGGFGGAVDFFWLYDGSTKQEIGALDACSLDTAWHKCDKCCVRDTRDTMVARGHYRSDRRFTVQNEKHG